jgi:hypothetical protein
MDRERCEGFEIRLRRGAVGERLEMGLDALAGAGDDADPGDHDLTHGELPRSEGRSGR